MATGRRTHSKSSGFSLIELLVAVTIIGLLAGAVTLAVVRADARRPTAAETAASLHDLFLHASVEAVMRGEVLAMELVSADDAGSDQWRVQWLRWNESEWQRAQADQHSALMDLVLPDGLEPELLSEATDLSSDTRLPSGSSQSAAVVFYPTGDISAFELLLHDRTATHRSLSAGLGNTIDGYLEVRP